MVFVPVVQARGAGRLRLCVAYGRGFVAQVSGGLWCVIIEVAGEMVTIVIMVTNDIDVRWHQPLILLTLPSRRCHVTYSQSWPRHVQRLACESRQPSPSTPDQPSHAYVPP